MVGVSTVSQPLGNGPVVYTCNQSYCGLKQYAALPHHVVPFALALYQNKLSNTSTTEVPVDLLNLLDQSWCLDSKRGYKYPGTRLPLGSSKEVRYGWITQVFPLVAGKLSMEGWRSPWAVDMFFSKQNVNWTLNKIAMIDYWRLFLCNVTESPPD